MSVPMSEARRGTDDRSEASGHAWDIDDVFALRALQSLGGRFLPWSGWAMRPSGLLAVLNEIVLGPRERILECGSGISTRYIARLLAERGGRVVSLEHDPNWAGFVERELESEGLGDRARIVLAPLEAHRVALEGMPWYRETVVREAVEALGGPIDLLLVDGPPAGRPEIEQSRYPALPVLAESLAPGAVVILDDASRPGERRVLERWGEESGIDFQVRADLGWIAIGRR
jgi:predicted O-methyltransferase YrrM